MVVKEGRQGNGETPLQLTLDCFFPSKNPYHSATHYGSETNG